jgi:hypothetical protein
MSVRESFVARFGESDAAAIEAAAAEHKNGVHDEPGSDYFRWAVVIAIGYQCMELAGYREYHGITATWADIKDWIKSDGDLARHDGDSDYLAVFAGTYNEFVGIDDSAVPA